jgi:virginiamycin B lyase
MRKQMCVCEERSPGRAIHLMRVVILLLATAGFSLRMGGVLHAATSPGIALTGQVSSAAEGPMEGVPVSARKDGSTITVSVTTDKQGRYSFPRNRLDPGHYTLRIRAIGYGLDGAASAEITADKTTTVDLALKKVQDISFQLTNTEWLLSMPGSNEDKYRMGQCGNCHTYERIVKSHYSADEFMDILRLMASFSPGSTPAHPQKKGTDGGAELFPGVVSADTARFLSTINLSSVDQWAYSFKTLPRPTGRATNAIITEYSLPRPEALPHDVMMDPDGLVWYRDFGTEFIGSLDPKTGKVTDYPFPELKPGLSTGMIDMSLDKDGNIWVATRQASMLKFDRKTHQFTACCANQSADAADLKNRTDFGTFALAYGPNNNIEVWGGGPTMPGIHRLDISTGKLEAFYNRSIYGTNSDSKGNGYGLEISTQNIVKVDAKTGELTTYKTPTPNSGPRRGQFDSQDRLWFAEFRANKIGMFDTRSETFKEWALPTPWTGPYDVELDKNGDAWTGGMFSDRLVRLNTKTGEFTEYLMPRNTNIRKIFVDNSTTPVTVWVGNNHGDSIVKFEPLD